jgi:4-hydroxy-4-methyl-2-oxoglutarate aldolase
MTDLERIERFKRAGYGGSVSDALYSLGVKDTVFSSRFTPLRQDMQLAGRAMPIKLHSMAGVDEPDGPARSKSGGKLREAIHKSG